MHDRYVDTFSKGGGSSSNSQSSSSLPPPSAALLPPIARQSTPPASLKFFVPAPQPAAQIAPEEKAGEEAGNVGDEAAENKGSVPRNDISHSSLAHSSAGPTAVSSEQAVRGHQPVPQQLQPPQRVTRPPLAAPQGYFVPASQPGRPRGAFGYNNAPMMNGAGVTNGRGGNGDILSNDAHHEMLTGRTTEVSNTDELHDVAL